MFSVVCGSSLCPLLPVRGIRNLQNWTNMITETSTEASKKKYLDILVHWFWWICFVFWVKSKVGADCILEEYFFNMFLYPNQLPFCRYENELSETKGWVTGRNIFFLFAQWKWTQPGQGVAWQWYCNTSREAEFWSCSFWSPCLICLSTEYRV